MKWLTECSPEVRQGGQHLDFMCYSTTLHHYNHLTTRTLSLDRVMAWHLRSMLDDALWRSEAGVPLPDLRTPPAWMDDLSTRLATLGIDTNPTP